MNWTTEIQFRRILAGVLLGAVHGSLLGAAALFLARGGHGSHVFWAFFGAPVCLLGGVGSFGAMAPMWAMVGLLSMLPCSRMKLALLSSFLVVHFITVTFALQWHLPLWDVIPLQWTSAPFRVAIAGSAVLYAVGISWILVQITRCLRPIRGNRGVVENPDERMRA